MFALLVSLAATAGAEGQRPKVEIALPAPAARGSEGPLVYSEQLLADARVRDLLTSGFPARIHYNLERWAVKRWFDDLRASFQWSIVVRHDPLKQTFVVLRARGNSAQILGEFATVAAADSAVGRPVLVGITPPHPGERSYYSLRVDVEMLSVSDLDELERWLRGELRPAIRGGRRAGTALERGTRTVLVRVLGGERRRYTARTEKFVP